MAGAETSEWLNQPSNIDLYVQALYQSEGYGIVFSSPNTRRAKKTSNKAGALELTSVGQFRQQNFSDI